MQRIGKLSVFEKISYALGDASANIAWRGVSTFLIIFYTDVFGLTPATVGLLMLVARCSDGVSDVLMGVVGDRTKSPMGHFRPWILWTAAPLGVILSLLFTAPDWGEDMKIAYAYTTYILFTLIYTANNIPYGALMAVMTPDDKERVSLGSFRMVGAFGGGMLVQGALLALVIHFGNVDPRIDIKPIAGDSYTVTLSTDHDVQAVRIETKDGIGLIRWANDVEDKPLAAKSFQVKSGEQYAFVVSGVGDLKADDLQIVDQKRGYSHAIYALSVILVLALLITFKFTRERVSPPPTQKTNLSSDLKDLIHNRPWIILLVVGLLFNIYNNMKQGITVIYFTHYVHNQLMAGGYMVALMVASIAGAMATTPFSRYMGKKFLFAAALALSGVFNILLMLCEPGDTGLIFTFGVVSELFAGVLPTLFFTMLGDAADYSEYVNGRRATGLIYSAGSFATKFGGGIAGAIIGWILGYYGYDGQNTEAIAGASEGIVMLMSWVPALIVLLGANVMLFYPLDQARQDEVTFELEKRRINRMPLGGGDFEPGYTGQLGNDELNTK